MFDEMRPEEHKWDPLPVDEAATLLSPAPFPWWIAGGWAIDLFLGRQTRVHGDTDVLIRREDQLSLQSLFLDRGWDLHKAQQGKLTPWPRGESLSPPVHDIWCRPSPDRPWGLQIMLLETARDEWVFRRDPSIGGSIASLGAKTASGVPYLRPEIQLLYKARPETAPKDQADFALVAPRLSIEARAWLLRALEKRFPAGHEWIVDLNSRTL